MSAYVYICWVASAQSEPLPVPVTVSPARSMDCESIKQHQAALLKQWSRPVAFQWILDSGACAVYMQFS